MTTVTKRTRLTIDRARALLAERGYAITHAASTPSGTLYMLSKGGATVYATPAEVQAFLTTQETEFTGGLRVVA